MAGIEPETEGKAPTPALRCAGFGAIAGAILVAIPALFLGGLVRDLAGPEVIVGFVVLGAVLGAYAWGAVAYDRRRTEEPWFTELEPVDAAEDEDKSETGVRWPLRERAQSLLRLPFARWQ
jgi:hypothetical protein